MKMPIAEVAITLVYLVSLVLAADQPSTMVASEQGTMTSGIRGAPSLFVPAEIVSNKIDAQESNVLISKNDRVALAHTIEGMMSGNTDQATMTNEDLFGLLTSAAANPAVFTNAAGIISAARSGDTGALANNVVGLLGAVLPPTPTTPAAAPTDAPVSEPVAAAPAADATATTSA